MNLKIQDLILKISASYADAMNAAFIGDRKEFVKFNGDFYEHIFELESVAEDLEDVINEWVG